MPRKWESFGEDIRTATSNIGMGFVRRGYRTRAEELQEQGTSQLEQLRMKLLGDAGQETERVGREILYKTDKMSALYKDIDRFNKTLGDLQNIPEGYGKDYSENLSKLYGEITKPPEIKYTIRPEGIYESKDKGKPELVEEFVDPQLLTSEDSYGIEEDEEGNSVFKKYLPVIDKNKGEIIRYESIDISEDEYFNATATVGDKLAMRYETMGKFGVPLPNTKKGKGKGKTGTKSLQTIKNKMTPEEWKEKIKSLTQADIDGMGIGNLEMLAKEDGLSDKNVKLIDKRIQ